jgi:hypothetical protein
MGSPFELPDVVTSSKKWSMLAETMARRLIMVLMSMEFDDETMQD